MPHTHTRRPLRPPLGIAIFFHESRHRYSPSTWSSIIVSTRLVPLPSGSCGLGCGNAWATHSDCTFPCQFIVVTSQLQAAEDKRFEEVGSKLRSQPLEADERKKEREIKLTDRVPSPKRPRTGCMSYFFLSPYSHVLIESVIMRLNTDTTQNFIPEAPDGSVQDIERYVQCSRYP